MDDREMNAKHVTPAPHRPSARAALLVLLAWSLGLPVTATGVPGLQAPHAMPPAKAASGSAAKPQPTQRLDINRASKAQLKTLSGIGDAEADKIIANRPYLTSTEIVSKAGLPAGLYIANKRQIVAIPKSLPKALKPAAKAAS